MAQALSAYYACAIVPPNDVTSGLVVYRVYHYYMEARENSAKGYTVKTTVGTQHMLLPPPSLDSSTSDPYIKQCSVTEYIGHLESSCLEKHRVTYMYVATSLHVTQCSHWLRWQIFEPNWHGLETEPYNYVKMYAISWDNNHFTGRLGSQSGKFFM